MGRSVAVGQLWNHRLACKIYGQEEHIGMFAMSLVHTEDREWDPTPENPGVMRHYFGDQFISSYTKLLHERFNRWYTLSGGEPLSVRELTHFENEQELIEDALTEDTIGRFESMMYFQRGSIAQLLAITDAQFIGVPMAPRRRRRA